MQPDYQPVRVFTFPYLAALLYIFINCFSRRMVHQSTEKYVEGLDRAIDEDREAHGKKCFQCLELILWNLKIFIG